MENTVDNTNLINFGKHIPHVLRQQLISSSFDNLTKSKNVNNDNIIECIPSIQRFHCALLFVDISGFTVLSQKLNVDQLRTFINSYFKKIIDIVDKYSGDVIKFAGDALFIIWKTKIIHIDSVDFIEASNKAMQSAVSCGVEVIAHCSNYQIALGSSDAEDLFEDLLKIISPTNASSKNNAHALPGMPSTMKDSSSEVPRESAAEKEDKEKFAYLNVHAGASIGVMAGIDVGANNRWEYLLVGQPLLDVAAAECEAEKGELIISGAAHSCLHPNGVACTCRVTATNNYIVEVEVAENKSAKLDGSAEQDLDEDSSGLLTAVTSDINSVYDTIMSSAQHSDKLRDRRTSIVAEPVQFAQDILLQVGRAYESNRQAEFRSYCMSCLINILVDDLASHVHEAARSDFHYVHQRRDTYIVTDFLQNKPLTSNTHRRSSTTVLTPITGRDSVLIRSDSSNTITSSTPTRRDSPRTVDGDDSQVSSPTNSNMISHSNTALEISPRRNKDLPPLFSPSNAPKNGTGEKNINRIFSTDSLLSPSRESISVTSSASVSRHGSVSTVNLMSYKDQQTNRRGSVKTLKERKHNKLLSDGSHLLAELRLITVLFISIDLKGLALQFDTSGESAQKTCAIDEFHFLPRTASEVRADEELLHRCQACMEIVTHSFQEKGGQLRQFIVDDKGTVVIGTFGLRGAANYDNTQAAIETARLIITNLQLIGMNASIGITSGKAYCGLVGSPQRHEYAVMGPSTNLSARLMGKAAPGEIICDIESKSSDRAHKFVELSPVQAKGYAGLVRTFRPVFSAPLAENTFKSGGSSRNAGHGNVRTSEEGGPHKLSKIGRLVRTGTQRMHFSSMYGRDAAIKSTIVFMQAMMDEKQQVCADREATANHVTAHMLDVDRPDSRPASRRTSFDENMSDISTTASKVIFGVDLSCKVISVEGPHGIGKSVFIRELGERFVALNKKNKTNNVIAFRNKNTSVNTSEPFHCWKSIFSQLFQEVHKHAKHANRFSEIPTRSSKLIGLTTEAESDQITHIMSQLSDKFKTAHPILASIGLIPPMPDNDATKKLSGATRLTFACELLGAILQQGVQILGKVVVVIIDDFHAVDSLSTQLFRYIYANCTGILILNSYRRVTNHNSELQAAHNAFSSSRISSDFHMLENSERFLRLDLSVLDEIAATNLVNDVFSTHTPEDIHEDVSHAIRAVSGGNPLYMFEIATAVARKYVSLKLQSGSKGNKHRLIDLVGTFRTNRIEEVICYRFDQLPPAHQLILKMASVACAHETPFTLPLLAYMVHTDSSASSGNLMSLIANEGDSYGDSFNGATDSNKLAAILSEILDKREFIGIVSSDSIDGSEPQVTTRISLSDTDDDAADFGVDTPRSVVKIEFLVALERNAINDLMPRDQKESLHDRVASYLEKERLFNMGNSTVSTTALVEEAFHWEQSTVWSSAMQCYFLAGMALDRIGALVDSRHYFASAYKMLDHMKREAGVSADMKVATPRFKKIIQAATKAINRSANDDNSVGSESGNNTPVVGSDGVDIAAPKKTNKADVYRIFGGDSDLLETGLNVLLRLGQSCLTLGNDPVVTSKLYEEALDLLTLCRSSSRSPRIDNKSSRMKSSKNRFNLSVKVPNEQIEAFDIKDPSICFPILSGIIVLYRTRKLNDDASMSKESGACNLFLIIARSDEAYSIHLMVGLTFLRNIYNELNRVTEGVELLETARETYDYSRDSAAIIRNYGSDRLPRVFAINAQILFMLGDLRRLEEYRGYLVDLFPRISHLNTLAMLCIPFCVLLVQLGRTAEALEWFSRYLHVESTQGGVSHFRELNPLMRCWFTEQNRWRLLQLSTVEGSDQQEVPADSEEYAAVLLAVETDIANQTHLQFKSRPFVHTALDFFGLGVEYMCASLCVLRVKTYKLNAQLSGQSTEDGGMDCALRIARAYLDHHITCLGVDSNYTFCRYSGLLLRAEVLVLLSAERTDEASGLVTEAKASLSTCEELARNSDYQTILLNIAVLHDSLGVDPRRAVALHSEAVAAVRKVSGTLNGDPVGELVKAFRLYVQ